MAPGVPIQRRDQEESGGESQGVEDEHAIDLDGGGKARRKIVAHDLQEYGGVKKLQWVNTKKNKKNKSGVQDDGDLIMKPIAAEKNVMRKPDGHQHEEANG